MSFVIGKLATCNTLATGKLQVKVKWTILHLERWWGAHLRFYGREPVRG